MSTHSQLNTTPESGSISRWNDTMLNRGEQSPESSMPTPASSPASSMGLEPLVEPIAIIGLSCRFPGGSSNPEKLWTNLVDGSSAWSKGPGKRFNMEAFINPDNSHPSTTNTNGGHFLSEDIAAFDAALFGIHSAEANAMDPQQRLMLEVAYEAFENAGLTAEKLWGNNTGVYVGQWTSDYAEVLSRDTEFPATYQTTGAGPAITSNRISYHFNLKGPSFTVDTGCSASLVALHQAILSLRSGESDTSFVGGVNLLVDVHRFVYQSKLKMFSKDGRSFPFDHRANGYGRGEGCAGLVLKPLSAALRDGDNVRAVIRNSALNQDGRTPGISAPSGEAQEKAIRKAYADAGLELGADYVEAHGTGTAIGDPIEAKAIAAALSKSRQADDKLPMGSIKGNIGHTESCAGLAGVIKAVLMLENGVIPPQVNFEKANPAIPLDNMNLRIPVTLETRDLKRISVNCFGYGGTNAHIIVDAANQGVRRVAAPVSTDNRPRVFVLSGASEKSCQTFAENLADYVSRGDLAKRDQKWMERLAYTLNQRSIYPYREMVVADNAETLTTKLRDLVQKSIMPSSNGKKSKIGFIFSGQGAQYYNMGRELINACRPFRESLERANQTVAHLGCTWDMLAELQRNAKESRLDQPRYGQPLSTAIQLALIDTLATVGLVPTTVAGHSSGEIAAAYCAGFLTFEDAMAASYHRGRLASNLLEGNPDLQGAMMAVGASAEVVVKYMDKVDSAAGKLVIACFNSPSSVTVSGDRPAIEALSQSLEADSVFNRVLRTSGAAYHSDQMRLIEREYVEALKGLRVQSGNPSITMVSSVTGCEIEPGEVDRSYWALNLISPVLFEDAVWGLCQAADGSANIDLVVEIGPHATLEGPMKQTIQAFEGEAGAIKYMSTLKRKANAADTLFTAMGKLFGEGIEFDLGLANSGFHQKKQPTLLADVPPYAFDHDQVYWHESRLSKAYRHRQFLPHELLGNLSADVNRLEPRWRRFLSLKEIPWIQAHVVQGQIVFPAAGYLAMTVEAVRRHMMTTDPDSQIGSYSFHNVSIGKALVITEEMRDHEICLSLRPEPRTARKSSGGWLEFRIFTVGEDDSWNEHCRGLIKTTPPSQAGGGDALKARQTELTVALGELEGTIAASQIPIPRQKFYFLSKDIGLDWKSPFDNVMDMKLGHDTVVSTVSAPKLDQDKTIQGAPKYIIHPTTLDSVLFQGLCAVLLMNNGLNSPPVPTFIQDLCISATHHDLPGAELNCYAARRNGPFTFDVLACAGEQVVLRAEGISATQLPGDVTLSANARELVHSIEWVTYCQQLTAKRVQELTSGSVPTASIAKQNAQMNALVMSHIQRTVKGVSPDSVVEGYRRQWYNWMQEHRNDPYDSSLVPANGICTTLGHSGDAISIIGSNLAGILKGEADPLALLSQDNLLSRLYSDERCQRCYSQMAAYIVEMGRQNPAMKVLEVGAGTGGATEPILQALCSSGKSLLSKYDFTDISSGFFESAKERLAKYSAVTNYRLFDAEKDAAAQGYEEGSYDLVIACNVVHATKSIPNTLDRVRSLLRPGGVFILMEITKDEAYYNLVFGSFPGWWLGDGEGRSMSPLLPASRWTSELTSHGFQYPSACLSDYPNDEGTLSVFISSAAEKTPKQVTLPIIVLGDKSAPAVVPSLAEVLKKSLGTTKISTSELQSKNQPGAITVFPPEMCEMLASDLSPEAWPGFKERLLSSKALLFVTKGATGDCQNPVGGMISGFSRCLRAEHSAIRIVTVDLDPQANAAHCAEVISTVLKSSSFDMAKETGDVELEFSERDGQLYVARAFHGNDIDRYVRNTSGASEPEMSSFLDHDRILTAQLEVPGLLDTLRWQDIEPAPLHPDEIQLDLRAASINFKDVLIAAGQLPGITEMKNDCSGVVTHVGANMTGRFRVGDRVCCYYSRSYTNRPRVHGDCCAIIPDSLSFDKAASLPIVWGTVFYSLVDQGRLSKGESILIHSAAGAVGQAAILLAQHLGATVFATVSTPAKKDFLVQTYGIPEDHIFSSRSTSFGKNVRDMTGGQGVDVLLNSLDGDMFRESCNTVAPYGRFVEIGRKDFMEDMMMPTKFLLKNITFAYVDLALLIEDRKQVVRRLLRDVVGLMASGAVRPTSIETMPISEIETAFRKIQAGKHMGKIILTVEDGQLAKIVPPRPQLAQLKPDGVYLIVGGLGGLGKSIVKWMAARGARNIITVSRSGTIDEGAKALIDDIRGQGVTVQAKRCDISSLAAVKGLVADIEQDKKLAPIRGVLNSAMVIKDSLMTNMTHEQWTGALSPKIAGSYNLHTALPKSLDFLLFMSSGVAISGNPGQTNYAAGCSYQDALAHHRCQQGLATFSINVGAVVDTGYVSENPDVAMALRRQGLGTITTAELLANLDYAAVKSSLPVDPTQCQWVIGLVPNGNERGLRPSTWMGLSTFRHLSRRYQARSESSGESGDLVEALCTATTATEALEQLCQITLGQLSKLIATPVKHLSPERSLDDYGVDSLVAVEFTNWIGAFLQASIPTFTIRSSKSINELVGIIAKESRLPFVKA